MTMKGSESKTESKSELFANWATRIGLSAEICEGTDILYSRNFPRLSGPPRATPLVVILVQSIKAITRKVSPRVRVAKGIVRNWNPQVSVGGNCSTM